MVSRITSFRNLALWRELLSILYKFTEERQLNMREFWFFFHFVIIVISASERIIPCRPVQFEYGINCECTESYCDTFNIQEPKDKSEFLIITSSEQGDRFSYSRGHFLTNSDLIFGENILRIDQTKKHERSKIVGFGGCITGSVTYILSKFTSKLRSIFYQSYFPPDDGIGYNLIRIPIGGTDFDFSPWTYLWNSINDTALTNFTQLDPRDVLRNDFIKEIYQVVGSDAIKALATAWTPPLWMKEKHELSGQPDNRLIPEFYQTWADYHMRWVDLMGDDGIPIWTIATGNEPYYAVEQSPDFPALNWDPGNQAKWFVDNLVPTLRQSNNAHIKTAIFEDARNGSLEYLDGMIQQRSNLMEYTNFITIHGYFDDKTSPSILDTIYNRYSKSILYDEMSFSVNGPIKPGSWSVGEELLRNMMSALLHDVVGYIDWNIVLDSKGGPTYAGNPLDAFIMTNEDYTAFYKQPLYYVMAHFSKFIPSNSKRIDASIDGPLASKLQTIAYLRPDDRVTVIIYNSDDSNPVQFTLVDDSNGQIDLLLKPRSLNTIVYSIEN